MTLHSITSSVDHLLGAICLAIVPVLMLFSMSYTIEQTHAQGQQYAAVQQDHKLPMETLQHADLKIATR